jgi:hypothetical protein
MGQSLEKAFNEKCKQLPYPEFEVIDPTGIATVTGPLPLPQSLTNPKKSSIAFITLFVHFNHANTCSHLF